MKSEILEKYIQAGKIAAEVREESAKMAKIDMPLLELAVKIEAMVLERGAEIAFPVNLFKQQIDLHLYTFSI